MMKHALSAAVAATLSLALATAACADEAPVIDEAATAAASEEAAETPFAPALWAVRDADSTLYLYGTIHLRRPGDAWGTDAVEAAIAEAEEVWLEVDVTEAEGPGAAQAVARLGVAQDGQTLSKLLDDAQSQRLDALLAQLGLPRAAVEPLRPWLAAVTIGVTTFVQAGYDPALGVDQQINAVAREQGKTMRAFETLEEQLGFLAGLSPEVQLQMLVEAVDEAEAGVSQLEAMDAAWSRGDVEALNTEMLAELQAQYPELYAAIITNRNAAWAETLRAELDGAGVDFVAVGAGHLIGDDSVQAMLADVEGLTIERIQ